MQEACPSSRLALDGSRHRGTPSLFAAFHVDDDRLLVIDDD
jgi:hypothetical protein